MQQPQQPPDQKGHSVAYSKNGLGPDSARNPLEFGQETHRMNESSRKDLHKQHDKPTVADGAGADGGDEVVLEGGNANQKLTRKEAVQRE